MFSVTTGAGTSDPCHGQKGETEVQDGIRHKEDCTRGKRKHFFFRLYGIVMSLKPSKRNQAAFKLGKNDFFGKTLKNIDIYPFIHSMGFLITKSIINTLITFNSSIK